MSLYFKTIRWQNFLSTGNQFTEIALNKSSSTLIVGENGAGKSTMLDAIMFALYGKPYRNITKPLLVNSITSKNCLVEVEFSVKNVQYLVRRGIKPNVFEIYRDGKLIDQHASIREYQEYLEKSILKLNSKSFTQIVVIGSANFVPFMQLKASERRSVIEDLLDIEIFTKMNSILKQKISANKEEIQNSKHQIDLLKQKIDITKKHINEIMSIQQSDRENKKNKIDELLKQIQTHNRTIQELQDKVQSLSEQIADRSSVKSKEQQIQKYQYQLSQKIETLDTDVKFFVDNDHCPTCDQHIDDDFKEKKISVMAEKKTEIETALSDLNKHYDEVREKLSQIDRIQTQINDLNSQIMKENTTVTIHQNAVNDLQQKLSQEKASNDTVSTEKLETIKQELKEWETKYQVNLKDKKKFDIAASLLKDDGIKARIIKQYIPVINKLVNKYLASLDFFVQFELDENFDEKIRSRFRDEFTYESFSEGEKMRVDLALLFTWRSVSKLRNSISTNLLILDEVFDSSLDSTGTDEFLKIITELTKDTNVFVISHKGDLLYDKFDSNIRFEKTKNFSQIAA